MNKSITAILLVVLMVMLAGIATSCSSKRHRPVEYNPRLSPYKVECRNHSVWIVTADAATNTDIACAPQPQDTPQTTQENF